MNVENFWKQLKHEQLHHLLHPQLDQLVFILIYKVTPMYIQWMDFLPPGTRLGCSKSPSPSQISYKENWAELRGKQCMMMYNRHHLCKHLVHTVESSVGKPPPKFWIQVSQWRVKPLYKHEALQGAGLVDTGEESGSITDAPTLADTPSSETTAPVSHTSTTCCWLNELPIEISHPHEQSVELNTEINNQGGTYTVDNTDFNITNPLLADWGPNGLGPDADGFSSQPGSSCATTPSNYEEDSIENEIDEVVDKLLARASELEEAARIIREQAPYRNTIWLKSLARRNIGKDVSAFVSDIQKHTGAHVRDNTWGDGSNRKGRGKEEERQRVANTMGYQMVEREGGE
ncbi:hypothetical protein PM082_014576 [Marasmius tenuissimus]|nr:hypothetical protein PM082_014576 [Marasmius tenuissimus]